MKAPIKVYDTNNGTTLTLIAETELYESCVFRRSRSEAGEFQIKIDGRLPKAQFFAVGRMVWIAPVKSRIGIITKIVKTKEDENESWSISGVEAKGICVWREIQYTGMDHYTVNAPAETVIKTAIKRFFGSTAEANRQISLINFPTDAGTGSNYLLNERFKNLLDAMTDCSNSTFVWWRFEINTSTGKLDVVVSAPTDRTIGTANPAPFSEKFQTVKTLDQTEDISEYANVAIVAGQGESTARTIQVVGTATGWARREAFFDARDLDAGDLTARGNAKLAEIAETVGIDITAMTKSQLVADQHYFVGDLVTVSAFNLESDKYITELAESWGASGYEVDLTFGKPVKTRTSDIKQVESSTFNAVSV